MQNQDVEVVIRFGLALNVWLARHWDCCLTSGMKKRSCQPGWKVRDRWAARWLFPTLWPIPLLLWLLLLSRLLLLLPALVLVLWPTTKDYLRCYHHRHESSAQVWSFLFWSCKVSRSSSIGFSHLRYIGAIHIISCHLWCYNVLQET